MALLGAKVARTAPTVDLATYAIDDASMQWLEDRLGSRAPKVSAVDSLAQSSLAPHERRFMDELLKAVRGGGRNVTVSVTQTGATEAQRAGFMQATLHPKSREPGLVGQVRNAVEAVLWGQENNLDAFCAVARDHASVTRTLAAVLVLGGSRGHGKVEALAALANGLYAKTDKGKARPAVHVVDLSTATDATAAALFEADGALGESTLDRLVDHSVVCISGANDLQARAPQVAQRLQGLLMTARSSADYRSLVYAFDFDQLDCGSVLQTLDKALGPVGTRVASAYAHFGDLGASTMQRYCLARLPSLLQSKALGNVSVDLDDAALSILGAALATPHMPLEELDARVYHLVMSHLEGADDGTQRCPRRVQMTAAVEADEAASIIANLTSPLPDITLARRLLRVVQVVDEAVKTPASVGGPAPTGSSTIAEIHADVVARAAAGNGDSLWSDGRDDPSSLLKVIAGMQLANGAQGVDLDDMLDFIARPKTCVALVEADTAIAVLASIHEKDDHRGEVYKGTKVPRPVLVTRLTLARVRNATPEQIEHLTVLANRIVGDTDYADEIAERLGKITVREEAPKRHAEPEARHPTLATPPATPSHATDIARVLELAKAGDSASLFSAPLGEETGFCEGLRAMLEEGSWKDNDGLQRLLLDANQRALALEPATTIAILGAIDGFGPPTKATTPDIVPGGPLAVVMALEAIALTAHASTQEREGMEAHAKRIISSSIEVGASRGVEGRLQGYLPTLLQRIPATADIHAHIVEGRRCGQAIRKIGLSGENWKTLEKATAGADPVTAVASALKYFVVGRPDREDATTVMAIIGAAAEHQDSADPMQFSKLPRDGATIGLAAGRYFRPALVALHALRLAIATPAQLAVMESLIRRIIAQAPEPRAETGTIVTPAELETMLDAILVEKGVKPKVSAKERWG